jgi:Primase C terminal 2 (PriCT-2)
MHRTNSKRSDQGAAWSERAHELAPWAAACFVVRDDAYGGHRIDGSRTTCHQPATLERLVRHFRADDVTDVIGLHVSSPDEMCRTTWIDIDAHDGDDADPDNNFTFALHVHDNARNLGFAVRLLDSNGKGGYHVLVVHRDPVPLELSWKLGRFLVCDYAQLGLTNRPETFPKSPKLTGKRFGGWVRLPGKHHKRDHYTRVWSPRREGWRSGNAAINSLLRLRGHTVDPASVIPSHFEPAGRVRHAHAGIALDVIDDPVTDTAEHRREVRLAKRALRFLGHQYFDDYERWVTIGMALRQLGNAGFKLWHDWSIRSVSYQVGDTAAKWYSFATGENCGGVTLGTLFRFAMDEGWDGPSADFEEIDEPTGIRRVISASGRRITSNIPVTHQKIKISGDTE